jgi:hypothetical protein
MSRLQIIAIDDLDLVRGLTDEINESHQGVAHADLFHPEEVEPEDLLNADLVLLDVDLGDWASGSQFPALRRPQDGLGLASVVRSYHRAQDHYGAVALLSDKLDKLASGLTPYPSEHAIARLHSLEWAFAKTGKEGFPSISARVVELASASRSARDLWPLGEVHDRSRLHSFLKLSGDTFWSPHAAALLSATQPPIFDLAAVSQGQAVVRWLAQRLLPHPGLLVDAPHVAVALGIDPQSLPSNGLTGGFFELIEAFRYQGELSGFLGERWWSSGIQSLIADRNDRRPIMTIAATTRLIEEMGDGLERIPTESVLCMDLALQQTNRVVPRHAAVRIWPDDWPVFADPAYIAIADLRNMDANVDHALALVDPADLRLLDLPAS